MIDDDNKNTSLNDDIVYDDTGQFRAVRTHEPAAWHEQE